MQKKKNFFFFLILFLFQKITAQNAQKAAEENSKSPKELEHLFIKHLKLFLAKQISPLIKLMCFLLAFFFGKYLQEKTPILNHNTNT